MANLTGLPVRLDKLRQETGKLQKQLRSHTQQSHGNDSAAGHKGGAGGGTDCDTDPTNTLRGPTVLLPLVGSEGSGLPVGNQLPHMMAGYDHNARHMMQMGQTTGRNSHRFVVAKHRTGTASGNTERTWTEDLARGVCGLNGTNAHTTEFDGTVFPDGMGTDTGTGYVLTAFFIIDGATDPLAMRSHTYAGVNASTTMSDVVISGSFVPPATENSFCMVQSLSASKGALWHLTKLYIFDVIDATHIEFNTAATTLTIGTNNGHGTSAMGASPAEIALYDTIGNAAGGRIQILDHDGVELTLYDGSHESFFPSFQNVLPNFLVDGICRINSMWCFIFESWDGTTHALQSAHPTQHP